MTEELMTEDLKYHFALEGELSEGEIFPILYYLYKESISCILVVEARGQEKRLFIEDGKIMFASSTLKDDAFGNFLLRKKLIDEDIFKRTSKYMLEQNKRFGRALIELGYFHYDQIWNWIPNHLKSIVTSFFSIKSGIYRILLHPERDVENIILDLDILTILLEGVRSFQSKAFLLRKFTNIKHLYVNNAKSIALLNLKPYEIHVFDLVKRESSLSTILRWSELLELDTLRLLYFFLVLEIIAPEKCKDGADISSEMQTSTSRLSTFTSFEEALRYYNLKYELIYKVMLKEIGPIALSLILKAVEDIMDNLPTYFNKIHFNSDGGINEESFLKAVWYHDFNEHIRDFLRGLEEILYTEIYAVKKHLGVESEQQVLKWINGIGN